MFDELLFVLLHLSFIYFNSVLNIRPHLCSALKDVQCSVTLGNCLGYSEHIPGDFKTNFTL